jgi:hypothetical protein
VTPRFTCGTADVGAADAARAGGKAVALSELARAGMTVWAGRDRAPIASPQAKAGDHVLARFRRAL